MHKIQEVVLFNFGLLLGASTNLQPPGVPKKSLCFGKIGENWIFQIETVGKNGGWLETVAMKVRQIPPGCFKTLHKFFYGDSRELTPNHLTVSIHQKPTIPKGISLFTPSKKTRKQLFEAVWRKKPMNNKNPKTKKKKTHRVEHPIFGLFVELQDRFQTIHMARPRWESFFWNLQFGRRRKKPWRFVSMVYIDFYTFYMLIYMYGMYMYLHDCWNKKW